MPTSTTKTEQLAALVAAKQHVLEIVVQLTKRQLEVIGTGDMPLLMKVRTSFNPRRAKLSFNAAIETVFFPPTLTPRRRAT